MISFELTEEQEKTLTEWKAKRMRGYLKSQTKNEQ